MLKLWKTFRYVALGGIALQFGGCFGQLLQDIPNNLLTNTLIEFLTDNDSVFDLFAD